MTKSKFYKASAMVITMFFVILLAFEAVMVTLILVRSSGSESSLRGENISNRRAADLVIESLTRALFADSKSGLSNAQLWAKYKRGGTDTALSNLSNARYNVTNPETGGTQSLEHETSAWVQEYRGNYFHLVGRVKTSQTDIITHRWLPIKSSPPAASCTAGLTTILTGAKYPGAISTTVDSTGRVFFGTNTDDDTANSRFYTWHEATGLTTILNAPGAGVHATGMSLDDQVYIGSGFNGGGTDGFWAWKNGVLTTIISPSLNLKGPGKFYMNSGNHTTVDPWTGRVYIGTASDDNVFTWKNGVLTTIIWEGTGGTDLRVSGGDIIPVGPDEAYFVGDPFSGSDRLFRWTPGTGLTTVLILGGVDDPLSVGTNSDGRVWIQDYLNGASSRIRTYKASTGLSTLAGTGYNFYDYWYSWFKPLKLQEFDTGQVFFSTSSNNYVWNPAAPNAAPTALPGLQADGAAINSTNKMVAYGTDSSSTPIYVWSPANGLSTLPGTYDFPARWDGLAWSSDDILYFGQHTSPGKFFSWKASTQQLTTIIASGSSYIGSFGGVVIDSNDRVYFGSHGGGRVYTYRPNTGLTTIVVNGSQIGTYNAMVVSPTGGVFFGGESDPGNFYYYRVCD